MGMKIQPEDIFNLKEHIIYASFEEGGVVFNLEDRVTHELNRTGISILDLLDGKRDLLELIKTFSIKFGQPEDEIKDDIFSFLQNLTERGWVYVR